MGKLHDHAILHMDKPAKCSLIEPEWQALANAILIRAVKDYADAMYKLEGLEPIPASKSVAYYERVKKSCMEYFESELYLNTTNLDYRPIISRWKEIDRHEVHEFECEVDRKRAKSKD